MIGTTLSHFRVTARLGEGGMGAVYRATDLNLERDVAIKVLPEDFARDPERLQRFDREAKLLASLSHASIASIFGLEEADGKPFLVLELVEGEDLAERVARGPIPLREALDLARQIAAGLEAAHERGIVHRDLKPANIKVTPGGEIKILDFGLAKAFAAPTASETQLPTHAPDMTQAGSILGTAAYMSPEQTRGETVDKRTDIWAFGVVLFEMLTGARVFDAGSTAESLASVLHHEPDWSRLPADVPANARRVLQRCLRKDPRERLRDIGDARIELGEEAGRLGPEQTSGVPAAHASVPPQATTNRHGMGRIGLGLGVLAVAIAAAVALLQLRSRVHVVYLIDTSAPLGVYDPQTRARGGTNADDISDLLGDLPVTLVKETTSPLWRRENHVATQRPSLVVIHYSAFAHQVGVDSFDGLGKAQERFEQLGIANPLELGRAKLTGFLGYVALASPETRFVVYSRGRFRDRQRRDEWLTQVEARFPHLNELKRQIVTILEL
jgi:hypothetical protein